MSIEEQAGVFVAGRGFSKKKFDGVQVHRELGADLIQRHADWFVLVESKQLPRVAALVREANERKKLRGLLVHHPGDVSFITAMLERAKLHTLVHTFVHADVRVLRRVLEAWAAGAQHRLVADATIVDGTLFVRTCALELLEVEVSELTGLRRVPGAERAQFEVDPDGSFLHWPGADVHIDLDVIRSAIDPEHRARVLAETLTHQEALGSAIRARREAAGLSQGEIEGLSRKQVGRIERGEARPRLESLRRFAAAHGEEVKVYLEAVAEKISGG